MPGPSSSAALEGPRPSTNCWGSETVISCCWPSFLGFIRRCTTMAENYLIEYLSKKSKQFVLDHRILGHPVGKELFVRICQLRRLRQLVDHQFPNGSIENGFKFGAIVQIALGESRFKGTHSRRYLRR